MSDRRLRPLLYISLGLGLCLILAPFYLTAVSAFKTNGELHRNFFGLPAEWYLGNFKALLAKSTFFTAFGNTLFIAGLCLAVLSVLLPMAAYPVARRKATDRFYRFLYLYMVSGLFIPVMVKLVPVIKLLNSWGLMNRWGLMLLYLAAATCEGVFLISGYLSTIPTDLEEAAYMDGASTPMVLFRIMLPLMKPITATVLIRNGLWFWNDYLLPSLLLKRPAERTLVLFQYIFKGEHAADYPLIFACFLLSMLPVLMFYAALQRNIVGSIISGAIKG